MTNEDSRASRSDGQLPALAAGGDEAGDDGDGRTGDAYSGRDLPRLRGAPPGENPYQPHEKLGLMMVAVRDGLTATSRAHGVPRRTLQRWLEEYGGASRVLAWLQAETVGAFLRWEQSLYAAVGRQLDADTFDREQAWVTLRKLVEARLLAPEAVAGGAAVGQVSSAGAAAGAQAEARITVRLVGDTGDDDVITIDRRGAPAEEDDG